MAAELLRKQKGDTKTSLCAEQEQHEEELDNLLDMARSKGYSHQGEMYSTENLGQLAKEFYGLGCQVISYGFEDHHFIMSELLKGSAVLVPYDADKNHKPCLENGHKAHWALLTGQCNNFEHSIHCNFKLKENHKNPILAEDLELPDEAEATSVQDANNRFSVLTFGQLPILTTFLSPGSILFTLWASY